MAQIKRDELNEKLVRHMVLTSLISYEKQYTKEYGEVVLAYDSKHYWRKDFFPHYKHNRKKDRKNSGLDWHSIFDVLNKIRDEIKEYFPYRVMEVYGAEADDVISVLCRHKNAKEKVLILSGDKDFIQLHKYPGIVQYNPILKSYISSTNPYTFIKEHIIKGDKSDGIPNFLSEDDTFVSGKRQKPISQKKLSVWVDQDPSMFCKTKTEIDNYYRNRTLIDLDYSPTDLEQKILVEFDNLNSNVKQIPLEYFRENQLNDLMENFYFRSSSPFKK